MVQMGVCLSHVYLILHACPLGTYKATGETCAVKVIRRESISDPQSLAQEVEILRKLDHPQVVRQAIIVNIIASSIQGEMKACGRAGARSTSYFGVITLKTHFFKRIEHAAPWRQMKGMEAGGWTKAFGPAPALCLLLHSNLFRRHSCGPLRGKF